MLEGTGLQILEHLEKADKHLQEAWKCFNNIVYDPDLNGRQLGYTKARVSKLALEIRDLHDYLKRQWVNK